MTSEQSEPTERTDQFWTAPTGTIEFARAWRHNEWLRGRGPGHQHHSEQRVEPGAA